MPAGAIGTSWASGSWSATAWEALTWEDASGGVTIGTYADMNTRLLVYLQAYYSSTNGSLTTLLRRYLNELTTGDENQKFHKAMQDATDAQT